MGAFMFGIYGYVLIRNKKGLFIDAGVFLQFINETNMIVILTRREKTKDETGNYREYAIAYSLEDYVYSALEITEDKEE